MGCSTPVAALTIGGARRPSRWGEAPRAHPTVKQCETCNQKPATVHITELVEPPKTSPLGSGEFQQRHVCERCAQKLNLLHVPVAAKFELNVLELLQSAHRARSGNAGPTCPDCGMTLAEFRSKGRMGCPKDYEVFREHLDPLLLRMHNATSHAGRLPGVDEEELLRIQQVQELQGELESAIREEKYERAARLRDELRVLESGTEAADGG